MFDPGLGGLTVLSRLRQARPDARYTYLADDSVFPYGALAEDVLVARVLTLMTQVCSTASTLVLTPLRSAAGDRARLTSPGQRPNQPFNAQRARQTARLSVYVTRGRSDPVLMRRRLVSSLSAGWEIHPAEEGAFLNPDPSEEPR